MKTMLIALTRPRMWSGVASWVEVPRTTTLTMSQAPASSKAASDSGKERERPKTMVKIPKPQTQPKHGRSGPASQRPVRQG